MISGENDQSMEEKIFFDGEKRDYQFYLNSIFASYVSNLNKGIQVHVDNRYFAKLLAEDLAEFGDKIAIDHNPITIDMIKKILQKSPLIIYLDDNFLGDYSHASHFVVISSIRKDGRFEILDPATGKCKYLTEKKLEETIQSLKKHIKMCPIVVTMK